MRKESWLLVLLCVLFSACMSSPAVLHPPPRYHLAFTQQGYALFAVNYHGVFTMNDGSTLRMSLNEVHEKQADGTFDAFLTLQGQVSNYPARGSIAPYLNGHFPSSYGDGPFFLGATYLGVLWMFSGMLNAQTGALSGIATLTAPGIAGHWTLTPL